MILDLGSRLGSYLGLSPLITQVRDFLDRQDLMSLDPGRLEIQGQDLFVMVDRAQGRSREEAPLEVHNRYLDIQYLLDGSELLGWRPRSLCRQPLADFDSGRDLQFFADPPQTWLVLEPGQFALFLPGDAHAPLVSEGQLHKLVFKLALNPGSSS